MNVVSVDKHQRKKTTHGLNVRLLVVTVIFIAIAVPVVYFWYAQSVAKIAGRFYNQAESLVAEADQLESAGNTQAADQILEQAVDSIWQYQRMRPEDDRATILLAQTFDRARGDREPRRASQLYTRAIARSTGDEKQEMKLRVAELLNAPSLNTLTRIRRDAIDNVQRGIEMADELRLSKTYADESNEDFRARVDKTLATLIFKSISLQLDEPTPCMPGTALRTAVASNPNDLDLPRYLAVLYRDSERHEFLDKAQQQELGDLGISHSDKADEIIDQMIDRNPKSSRAYLVRYEYRTGFELDGAADDLRRAIELEPGGSEINFFHGRFLLKQFEETVAADQRRSGTLDDEQIQMLNEAKSNFETCLAANPDSFFAALYLGDTEFALGNTQTALDVWSGALAHEEISAAGNREVSTRIRERMILQLLELERIDEAETELEAFDAAIRRYSAVEADPGRLAPLIQTREILDGVFKRRKGLWAEAIAVFEKASNDDRRPRESRITTLLQLADLLSETGLHRQAAAKYQMALRWDAKNQVIRRLLASSRTRSGQIEEAVLAFETVARSTDRIEDWLTLGQLMLAREQVKPPQQRNWQAFNAVIQRATELDEAEPGDLSVQLEVLKWNSAAARELDRPDRQAATDTTADGHDNLENQLQHLVSQLEQNPDQDPERLRQLAYLNNRAGDFEKADEYLARYESAAGNTADRYITRANVLLERDNIGEVAEVLQEGLARVDASQRRPLELAQVNLLIANKKFDEAVSRLSEIVEQYPDEPNLVIQLTKLVIQLPGQIKPEPASWESKLKDIEGTDGPLAKYLAARRILLKLNEVDELKSRAGLLERISRLSSDIGTQASDWPQAHSLAGMVLALQFDHDRRDFALKDNPTTDDREKQAQSEREKITRIKRSFQRAFELGERSPFVISRLVELETDPVARRALLDQLSPRLVAGNERLTNMQATLLAESNDLESARATAERATQMRSDDSSAWITRARMELINGDSVAAELSAAKARELADGNSDLRQTLVELFNFYSTADQYTNNEDSESWKQKAYELIDEIVELESGDGKTLVHAGLLEQLDNEQALELYRNAIKQFPENAAVHEQALFFIGRLNSYAYPDAINESIQIAEKLVQLKPQDARIRRILAALLSRRGADADWNRVADTLVSAELNSGDSYVNQRSLAALLTGRADVTNTERLENLQQAYGIVRDENRASDLILAGQILRNWADLITDEQGTELRDEKIAQSHDCYKRAVEASDSREIHLFVVTNFFIDEGLWDTADFYLRKLRNLKSRTLVEQGPTVSLTARLMHGRGAGDPESVVKVIEDYGNELEQSLRNRPSKTQAQAMEGVARMFDAINNPEQAIAWRKKVVAKDPEMRVALARDLARNGDFEQSRLECTRAYEETGRAQYITMFADLLIMGNAPVEQYRAANEIFEKALKDSPDEVNLLVAIANAWVVGENRVDGAARLYEQALQIDPDNLLLLNNMATVYSEVPEQLPDALRTIDRAIDIYGNRPGLLDTRAVILMLQGNLDEAERLLLDVVNQQSDSRYWWHLAEVKWARYQESGQPEHLRRAQSCFNQSLKMELEKQILTPGEKKRIEELRRNLANEKSGASWKPELLRWAGKLRSGAKQQLDTRCPGRA